MNVEPEVIAVAMLVMSVAALVQAYLFYKWVVASDPGNERMVEIASYVRQGANAYLGVIVPIAVAGLILPNYTVSTPAGYMSVTQAVFAIITTFALYLAFLGIQTTRHREYFIEPTGQKVQLDAVDGDAGEIVVGVEIVIVGADVDIVDVE